MSLWTFEAKECLMVLARMQDCFNCYVRKGLRTCWPTCSAATFRRKNIATSNLNITTRCHLCDSILAKFAWLLSLARCRQVAGARPGGWWLEGDVTRLALCSNFYGSLRICMEKS